MEYSDTIENVVKYVAKNGTADGKLPQLHAMPCGARTISGVTAGILRNLYERLNS